MDYGYSSSAVSGYESIMALFTGAYGLVVLAVAIVSIVALWKIFEKAGQPGWGAIVPFYNTYLLFKISFGNGWLFLLLFVPVVNAVMAIILCFKLAKAFGKGVGFGFGLLFLEFIFILILAFDKSQYVGA